MAHLKSMTGSTAVLPVTQLIWSRERTLRDCSRLYAADAEPRHCHVMVKVLADEDPRQSGMLFQGHVIPCSSRRRSFLQFLNMPLNSQRTETP